MQCGDDGNADTLRRKGGKGRELHFFEAIYDKNGYDRGGQDFADISDQQVGALFPAEQRKREKPCQKGADSNGQYNSCVICVIHITAPSFAWMMFLARRIMTMEAISAGRIKLPGPKIRRETMPQRRPAIAGI